jgi:hypothetical protein
MDNALSALRRVDFDWTAHIDQIWSDHPADVGELQAEARAELREHLDDLGDLATNRSPLGFWVLGSAGSGKTHLLGVVRSQAIERGFFFVLADMTDVQDFWATVLLGYLRSLMQRGRDGRRQLDHWLAGIIEHYGATVRRARQIPQQRPPGLINTCNQLIAAVTSEHRDQGQEHADVLRALVLFACDHADINDLGYKWLQGVGIDDDEKHHHGFREAQQSPQRIVRGLSWLLSLEAPTVLALDQLDAILAEHNLATSAVADEPSVEQQASLAIIQGIAGGLLALRDVTRRTLLLVSTLEATWKVLETRAAVSMADRYEPPLHLGAANPPDAVQRLVLGRLQLGYRTAGFTPPYPTYPFKDGYFEKYRSNTPREVLKACDAHRRTCRKAGTITEIGGTPVTTNPSRPPSSWRERIRSRVAELQQRADVAALLTDDSEQSLDRLVETACQALVLENPLPNNILPWVEKNFLGTGPYEPLHARIRLILTDEQERERHHAFRFLQKSHYRAFQVRLKAAITASGIDHAIGFRRLTILRHGPPPSGAATQKLMQELTDRGGRLLDPAEPELRTLWALSQLLGTPEEPEHFEDWLRADQPVSRLPTFRPTAEWLLEGQTAPETSRSPVTPISPEALRDPARPPLSPERPPAQHAALPATPPVQHAGASAPTPSRAEPQPSPSFSGTIPVGRLLVSGTPEDVVTVDLGSLANHTSVLAGSGSGKTVFLRRIIEEAALLGVPSIVLDGANDLARLGDPWPERPESFTDEDAAKADRYQGTTDVVVWTPGLASGNPLSFNPIPDFSAAVASGDSEAERQDQLQAAVDMARSSLEPLVAPGHGAKDKKSRGILASALHRFAERSGGSLADLIGLLQDPPDEVIDGYHGGDKIAREISELLLSAAKTDPLLGAAGASLDPALLLRSPVSGKTRVSVINLSGLRGQAAQQKFVNQLVMTLFTWIKRHPAPSGALLGLLVVDEAKDYVPSGRNVPGKENIVRLAAQARKYGLGMLFASQAPKSIDHTVVANCATLLVGKANSPAAIETVKQLLQEKGGTGGDVGRLARGTFYLSAARRPKPVKIATSLCLSYHPSSPPSEAEVLMRARRHSGEKAP